MNLRKILWTSAAFLVIAGVFDMLCFWCVAEYTTSFYISVAFGNISLLVYALASLLMAKKGKYIYLSFQDGFIIGGYTGVCVILNLCFALCKMNDAKINIITNIIILAIYLVVLFLVFANTAMITAQLADDRRELNAYYKLKDKAERLLGKGINLQANKRIESMYDKICSCQINRTVDVSAIDAQILSGLTELEISLEEGSDQTTISSKIAKVIELVDDRNRQITNHIKR